MSVSLIMLLAASQPMAATPPAEALYRVKKGDTLYELAEDFFIRPSDYRIVQQMNKVGNPRLLPIGKTLRIPRRLLRTTAVQGRVMAFRGDVMLIANGRRQAAAIGAPITEGAVVSTGAKAFVTVSLPDGSRISLPSNSRVGIGRLRQTLLTGEVERAFHLQDGRSEWDVAKAKNRGDTFRVNTPVATAAVRGTSFRVTYDEASRRSTVGVVEGAVAVAGAVDRRSDMINSGRGIAVHAASDAADTPLAPAPTLQRAGAVQKNERIDFSVDPIPGAGAYLFELSTDAGFVDRVAETLSADPATSFDSLPNGTYFVRTSIVTEAGLQGMANTYSFDRRLNKVSLATPEAGTLNGRKSYRFRWHGEGEGDVHYRFTLSRDEAGQDRIIDQTGIRAQDISVTDLQAGLYYWRIWSIRFEDGRFIDTVTPPQKLQIGPIE